MSTKRDTGPIVSQCPKCGSDCWCDRHGYRWWKCGSRQLWTAKGLEGAVLEQDKCLRRQIATLQAQLAAAREECEAMLDAIWGVKRTTYLDDNVINRFHTLDCNSEALKKLFAFTMPKEERDAND